MPGATLPVGTIIFARQADPLYVTTESTGYVTVESQAPFAIKPFGPQLAMTALTVGAAAPTTAKVPIQLAGR